jgi:FAD/FMN-containing dehydrogenase/Fe-S oxidoreductase
MDSRKDPQVVGRHLAQLIRGEVRSDPVTRHLYSTAACIHRVVPLVVLCPRDAEDVAAVARFCAEETISLTARGAGTSLAGQALGAGVIVDFSRHMNSIQSTNLSTPTVRAQPGVVGDALAREVNPRGFFFPAEPSSGAYATVGGMVANNASGARSLRYGPTRDYVLGMDVVLADGSFATLRRKEGAGSWTALERQTCQTLQPATDLVHAHGKTFPKNSSGYLLRDVCGTDWVDLSKLIVGSEGTLAMVTEVELRVSPVPAARALLLTAFETLEDAVQGVLQALPLEPSAIEIMGRDAIAVVQANRPALTHGLPERLEAVLLIETEGETADEAVAPLVSLDSGLRALTTGSRLAVAQEEQDHLWELRKAGLPILYRRMGPRRVAAFIEDNAVPPARIAEYVRGLKRILGAHGLEMALFGHAGQGNFHIRPLVDLASPTDRRSVVEVAREVAELVVSLGGSLSGEHGDGRSRSEFLPLLHGPLYPVMEQIKQAFDPDGILNPGIIVGAPVGTITASLRADPGQRFDTATTLSFSTGDAGLQENVERCQGCGTCRTPESARRMCSAYRATLREEFSPRAKANLLRELQTGRLPLTEDAVELIASRCLQCGMCAAECPAGVDVPALVLELRARLAAERGVGVRERFFDWLHFIAPLGGRFHHLVNPMLRNSVLRVALERTLGIAAHAALPGLRPPLPRSDASNGRRVAYLADTYAGRLNPETGRSVRAILGALGLEVIEPSRQPSGAVAMMCGDFEAASREVRKNLDALYELARQDVTIIVSEPTAYHAIHHLYHLYGGDDRAAVVARRTQYLHEFLAQRELSLPPAGDTSARRVVYHIPCHVARQGWDPPFPELLRRLPNLQVEVLEEGCCGAAGTFGYKKETYELSRKVGERLAHRLQQDDFDIAVTDCSSCFMRMQEHTPKAVHAVEFLAHALGLAPPPGACATVKL